MSLNLRIAYKHKIGRIPEVLARRRIHPDSFYSSGYDNQYIYQLPVYEKLLSDPTIEQVVGISKRDYLCSFILKFIFKNLYDDRLEFIDQKLRDLERYSSEKAKLARNLVSRRDVSTKTWQPLIPEFDVWQADVAHKAALYKERRAQNFNAGAGRLEKS